MTFDEHSEHALSGAIAALQALADRPEVRTDVKRLFTTEAVFFDTLLRRSLAGRSKEPQQKEVKITRQLSALLQVGDTTEMLLNDIERTIQEEGELDRVGENVRRLLMWISALVENYLSREFGPEAAARLRVFLPAMYREIRREEGGGGAKKPEEQGRGRIKGAASSPPP